ncbi:MAG TPA: PAS domain S-box protein, partial [Spirochaetia bacterium]|nr:PAS domain S-box protein [Spirochaetia bacterium]
DLGLALHLIGIERRNAAYAQIVENHHDAMALFDLDEKYEEVNPAYLRLVRFDRDAIIGRSLKEILGPEFLAEIKPSVDRCFEGEQPTIEVMWAMPGLETMHFEAQLAPCRADNGSIFSASVTLRDITEHKKAEESIKEQLAELQRWQDVTLDREDRMQALKREVNELCRQKGESERYPSQRIDTAHFEAGGVEP